MLVLASQVSQLLLILNHLMSGGDYMLNGTREYVLHASPPSALSSLLLQLLMHLVEIEML